MQDRSNGNARSSGIDKLQATDFDAAFSTSTLLPLQSRKNTNVLSNQSTTSATQQTNSKASNNPGA